MSECYRRCRSPSLPLALDLTHAPPPPSPQPLAAVLTSVLVRSPKDGKKMKASADGHVNHSRNDDEAQAERQGDPHSHAIVLEPTTGTIAYVPDLGMDVIRQFHFDEQSGAVTPCGIIPSGVKAAGQRRGLGPRYIQFAKDLHTCYVVNELSSQVAVFAYDPLVAAVIAEESSKATTLEERREVMSRMEPTLKLVQTVSTLPEAFPRECNTCGRITIHPSGDFVVTSNRGHDSIAVHRIHRDANPPGLLTLAGIFHTRGETPRHFQFDKSGQWCALPLHVHVYVNATTCTCMSGQVGTVVRVARPKPGRQG